MNDNTNINNINSENTVNTKAKSDPETDNCMDNLMKMKFSEKSTKVAVSFRKTCFIRDYETEVVEADTEVTFDHEISGAEREFIATALQAQMEYAGYAGLRSKKLISEKEFAERKKDLATSVVSFANKLEQIEGPGSVAKYFKD